MNETVPDSEPSGGVCLHCERYRHGSACQAHPDAKLADPTSADVMDVLRAIDARRHLRRLQLGWALGAALGAAIVLGAWLQWGTVVSDGRTALYWLAPSVVAVVFIARVAGWYALTTFELRFSRWTGDKAHMLRGAKLWKRQNQLRKRYRSVADLFK